LTGRIWIFPAKYTLAAHLLLTANRAAALVGPAPRAVDCRPLPNLNDNEGTLLALVIREQPMTAYQIAKVYEESPVSNFNTSKGKIYPLVRRLRDRGYLSTEPVEGDSRGTERLIATKAGRDAVKTWVKGFRSAHSLLEDPLRTKVQSFDLLSRDERIEWLVETKAQLAEKLAEVERYGGEVSVPFHDFVHDNAVSSLRSRMDWLDRTLHKIVKG
jgi:DNA-binding PadR family transcriptional regulator